MNRPPLEQIGKEPSMPAQIPPARRFIGLIRLNWDFIALLLLAGLLLLLMLADASSLSGILATLRLVVGLAFMLFAPGYALQAILFPRPADLDQAARLGLAIGLSIAILPPLALVLDRLPWGLRPWPSALSLILVTLVTSFFAQVRRARLSDKERTAPALRIHFKSWWSAQDRSNRRLVVFLGVDWDWLCYPL
jgi:uncharacterized membrane protein